MPRAEVPPATPFTDQFTFLFELPVTITVNCCASPALTFAIVGEMETLTPGGGGLLLEEVVAAAPQPT